MNSKFLKPNCFAQLDKIFPLEDNGLRSVREDCRKCELVKECLRTASESPIGLEMRAQRMEAMEHGRGQGVRGFLSRWSELKSMRRTPSPGGKKRTR